MKRSIHIAGVLLTTTLASIAGVKWTNNAPMKDADTLAAVKSGDPQVQRAGVPRVHGTL